MNNLNEDFLSKNLNINESIEYNNIRQSISGGIDPERIINKEYIQSLGDFYKCSICFKIMIKPTDCEECGHSYCQECITKLKCPFGCENKSLKNSSIGIINLLKNLKFNCLNEGCSAVIPYIDVKNHDANCEYQKILCTNKRCRKRVIKKELVNHIEKICKYTLIKCNYCHTDYYRKEINEHQKLCALTFNYLQNYNKKINDINTNEDIEINEKIFHKYIKNLSVYISKILKENIDFRNMNVNKKNDNKIIKENKNEEIIKEVDDEPNKNKNNDESKQSVAQIEEDDLVDIIKKVVDEKLSERYAKYDMNFNEFYKYLSNIKSYVCNLNTIEEVKESEEEDNDDEENANMESFSKEKKSSIYINGKNTGLDLSNSSENNNNDKKYISDIREDLQNIINSIHMKIRNNIAQLNINIINYKKENYNNEAYEGEEYKIPKMEDINFKIRDFSNYSTNCLNERIIKMNNLNESLKKICNNLKTLSKENNINDNKNIIIIDKIKVILSNIVDKSNNTFKENLNNYNPEYIQNLKNNNIFLNEISEIDKSINNEYQNMNTEISEVNKEILEIKDMIKNLQDLITNKFNNLSNQINNEQQKLINNKAFKKNNLIKEITFNFLNEKKKFIYSRIKSVMTIQPKNNKNNIHSNMALNSSAKTQKIKKRFNSTKGNLPRVNPLEDIEYQNRSHSSTSLYFYGSDINIHEKKGKENLIIDNNRLKKLLKIELKIKDIFQYMEYIPDIVKAKIDEANNDNMKNIKEKVMKTIDDKMKNIFSHKYCEECEKIEYFFGFASCFKCSNLKCKNCLMLCRDCKHFFCKNCIQKNHQCEKIISN